MTRPTAALSALLCAASLLAATAHAQDDDGRLEGERLAHELCAGCHLVAEGQAQPAVDGVPSFEAIAASGRSDDDLRVWLADPHPPMPDMPLSEREIAAVVAYIRSYAD